MERSPQAVADHDRQAWVDLFTTDATVEDPVGSRPHRGHDQLRRFFDTFIGPRDIAFERDLDIVADACVIRALTLRIRMSPTVTLAVPAILRYRLDDVDGELKISALQAYWELPAMMARFAGSGIGAVPAGLRMGYGLLVNQRLTGTAGFLRGLRGARRRNRARLEATLTALSVGDDLATRRHLGSAAVAPDLSTLRAAVRGASWDTMVAAGGSVAAVVDAPDRRLVVIADVNGRAAIQNFTVYG